MWVDVICTGRSGPLPLRRLGFITVVVAQESQTCLEPAATRFSAPLPLGIAGRRSVTASVRAVAHSLLAGAGTLVCVTFWFHRFCCVRRQ